MLHTHDGLISKSFIEKIIKTNLDNWPSIMSVSQKKKKKRDKEGGGKEIVQE